MSREEIKEKLIVLCAEIFQGSGIDRDMIKHVDFIDDLGMDSLTFITLILEIETCFNITVPDEKLLMENFKRIDNIILIINKQLEK